MENNFFQAGSSAAFETAFWKWFFQWANYSGESPGLEEAARSLLGRLTGEDWRPGFSLKVISNEKVNFLLLINERKAIVLNRNSLTLAHRQELIRIRTDLLYGTIPEVKYPIEPADISVIYFEFGPPTVGIRKKLPENEQVLLDEKLAELQEKYGAVDENPKIEEAHYWENPVEHIIRFDEVYQILQDANEKTDNDIFKNFFRFAEEEAEEEQKWKICPTDQWSPEMARGFARFWENRNSEITWDLENQDSFHLFSGFIPVPDEFPLLETRIKGLRVEICGDFEDAVWEYLITALLQTKELPTRVLMDTHYQLKQNLSESGMVWYKKRFLPKKFVPVIAAPFIKEDCEKRVKTICTAIKKIDWARLEGFLAQDMI